MKKIDPEKIKKMTKQKISYSNYQEDIKNSIQKKKIAISLCCLILTITVVFNFSNKENSVKLNTRSNIPKTSETMKSIKTEAPKNDSDSIGNDKKDSSYPKNTTTKKVCDDDEFCEE